MRAIYVISFLFLANLVFGQLQNKVEQIIPPIYLGDRWDDFCLLNDTLGFVVTSEGFVYKTTDAFRTMAYKANLYGYSRSIAFLNDSVGFIGNIDFMDRGNLFQTVDGGNSWTNATMDLIANDTTRTLPYGICGLAETDNTVYACGAYYGRPFVARFEGVGQPWVHFRLDSFADGLVDMHWLNADTGFVTGRAENLNEGGIILHTQDGGVTWTRVFETATPMDFVWKLFPLNDSIIYAGIQSYAPYSARMAKSTDGGMTWTQYEVDTASVSLQGIGFVNEMEGYVGGHFEGYYATIDGGLNWNFVNDTTVGRLNRFLRLKDKLLVSGTSIYSVTDSNYVGVRANNQVVMQTTLKIHPNPTSGAFILEIDLSNNTNGHILVYDISGKILAKVPHQEWELGQHIQHFDSSQFPAGTYYVGFITDHGNWFAPIVVSR